jgi:hypothetical protein
MGQAAEKVLTFRKCQLKKSENDVGDIMKSYVMIERLPVVIRADLMDEGDQSG